jgi:hypothetical protein
MNLGDAFPPGRNHGGKLLLALDEPSAYICRTGFPGEFV